MAAGRPSSFSMAQSVLRYDMMTDSEQQADITDLAVVAVLTVFSTTHELATPSSIPTFFSYGTFRVFLADHRYFVVICWIWTAQIHYDIRYQAEDVYHRFVKGLQITLFLYIGAASGNWNLGLIQDTASMSGLSGRQTAAYG